MWLQTTTIVNQYMDNVSIILTGARFYYLGTHKVFFLPSLSSERKETSLDEKAKVQTSKESEDVLVDNKSEISSQAEEEAKPSANDTESYFPPFLSEPEFVALGIFVDENAFIYAHEVRNGMYSSLYSVIGTQWHAFDSMNFNAFT